MRIQSRTVTLVVFFLLLLGSLASAELVLDNTSSSTVVTGAWYSSTTVPGFYGTNYLWANSGNGSARVDWVFQVPRTGDYQVSAWWSAPYSSRSPNAPYTIQHAAGSTTVTVNQNANGSQWNSLGIYHFSAGEARVFVTNNA